MCLSCKSEPSGRKVHLIRLTFPNKLQDLEVFGAVVLLIRFLESHLEVDLSNDDLGGLAPFQLEPAFEVSLLLAHAWAHFDMAEEGVLIRTVVHVDIKI